MRRRNDLTGRDSLRRYPPLFFIVVTLALAVFALPSALNLPQANPGQTLEYAPLPGNASSSTQAGNFAGLGLASGVGPAGGDLGPGTGAGLSLPGGSAGHPSDKECVGSPPHQTEDLLSPPCVGFFAGDNGGATYTGVARYEVTVLFYFDGGSNISSLCGGGAQSPPANVYVDLDRPEQPGEYCFITYLRAWSHYFNSRYQTYGRHIHMWIYYTGDCAPPSTSCSSTDASRRQDAADNFQARHPFATLNYAIFTPTSYQIAMAAKGVLQFAGGINTVQPQSFYARYPGLIWTFHPSTEETALTYSSFVCTKVRGYNATFSGNPGETTRPRVFGYLYPDDSNHPELTQLADIVRNQLKGCGMSFVEHSYPVAGTQGPTGSFAVTNMADFQKNHVTTILMPGGIESADAQAASSLGYHPEWVTGFDFARNGVSQPMPPDVWSHAWTVSPVGLTNAAGNEPACQDAFLSVDAQANATDVNDACFYYDDLRQLFTGIQVAGPKLTPTNLDQGFHAIPPKPSPGLEWPACFYDPGDYTCVKDAVAEWWDQSGPPGGSATNGAGCWRIADSHRFLRGRWPAGDVLNLQHFGADPCNYA